MGVDEAMRILLRGAAEVISEEELRQKLENSTKTGKPLRIKLGVDPTAPDIHLGHTVVLRKLRKFQDLGHVAVLIIGDFTAKIGDPSGRSKTRPPLTDEEIEENAKTYKEQVFKILDPKRTELRRNSEWLSKLSLEDTIKLLLGKYTLARIIERDDFSQRLRMGSPIFMHEILYPLLQAYDSIMVEADVEMGGTDQKFNILVGRDFQEMYGQQPQVAFLMPLIEGTDGVQKMSKSLGNYIALNDPPLEMYGKIMSIPDNLIVKYMVLLTDIPDEEVEFHKEALSKGKVNPRDVKARLAHEIVRMYWGKDKADWAEEEFDRIFKKKQLPSEIPEVPVSAEGRVWLPKLLKDLGLVRSTSEAKRLIAQRGVRVNGSVVGGEEIVIEDGMVIQVGRRRFVRVRVGGQEKP